MKKAATGGGNTERLRTLMDVYGLSSEQIALMTGRAIKTVYGWRQGSPHAIPSTVLRLLEIDLQTMFSNAGGHADADQN